MTRDAALFAFDDGAVQLVPVVRYLELDPPRLTASECVVCQARFFDRRNACACCGGSDFRSTTIDTHGTLRSFTIVYVGSEGTVPFVSAVVDCSGTTVRGNLVNTPADASAIRIGMPVRLVTWSLGEDDLGVNAIGYGFESDDTESV